MPNGKPHDNPISDTLIYGMHPFPADIEQLVIALHKLDPHLVVNELEWAPFDWEQGKYLNEACVLLRALIDSHGDPNARRQYLETYRAKTQRESKRPAHRDS
jgi:hypothetical protein